ncbi:MAG TPA: GNAT family N-acetyltransferase, partial [Gaiellaceae bacterium]|nr:GNAT family N-acetyltransferase [Gaiellaceae bacterium]
AEAAGGLPPLQFAIADATPAALDPWYRLGFAQMHAYAARASGSEPFDLPGVTLRQGTVEDIETALRLDRLVYEAQAAPPSFSPYEPDEREHRQSWRETLEADDVDYRIAERAGRPVGHVTLYPDPGDGEALHLASTAVVPEERGAGVGRLLTAFALRRAAELGLPRLRTNWRVTNLVASRYWPARGFELTHIRLVRRVGDL